jgi:predicted enzyme related to lactoylglutathione lyase
VELRLVRETDRFDDACRFFGEVLGWPVTHEWDGGPHHRGRIFGFGDSGRIELLEVAPGDSRPVDGVFCSAECADVSDVHERVVAAGIGIDDPMADRPWGHRSFAVIEPTGMRLVFFQRLDG